MSVKVTKRTPKLDKAQQLMRDMQGRWRIVPRVSSDSADKLGWLAARDRDFLRVTTSMEQSCVRFVRAELSFACTGAPALRPAGRGRAPTTPHRAVPCTQGLAAARPTHRHRNPRAPDRPGNVQVDYREVMTWHS
jgi:hypothetical protein